MKIKYYLRGLGTGIIFTAIVLMIIYSYRTTDSKTIDRARGLGMIMPGETTKQTVKENENKTENNSMNEPETKEPGTKEPSTNEPGTKEPATNEPATNKPATNEPATNEPATNEPSTNEPATEKQTDPVREITFTISSGMYSEVVSQRLEELGVIDNAAGLNSFLVSNGYAERIRTGVYTFTTGMSYADVAAIISR